MKIQPLSDKVLVQRIGLQNGASIALLLLMTDAIISEIPEKKKKTPAIPADDEY